MNHHLLLITTDKPSQALTDYSMNTYETLVSCELALKLILPVKIFVFFRKIHFDVAPTLICKLVIFCKRLTLNNVSFKAAWSDFFVLTVSNYFP